MTNPTTNDTSRWTERTLAQRLRAYRTSLRTALDTYWSLTDRKAVHLTETTVKSLMAALGEAADALAALQAREPQPSQGERVPVAWSEFGDGHDYSRTGKHDPNNCRYCLRAVLKGEPQPPAPSVTADVNDGAFGSAAYCHHRHHLDEHSTDFDTCPHSICTAARRAASAPSVEGLSEREAAAFGRGDAAVARLAPSKAPGDTGLPVCAAEQTAGTSDPGQLLSVASVEGLVQRVADEIQKRGRKHATGEPLFFDRYTLEQAIEAALRHPRTEQCSGCACCLGICNCERHCPNAVVRPGFMIILSSSGAAPHPSHKTRISMDASSFDEICVNCGATDEVPGGWGRLALPCPQPEPSTHQRHPRTGGQQ